MNNCKCPPHIPEDPCWESACACKEDHTKVENIASFTTTVKCITPFNMPVVDEDLELQFEDVVTLLPGGILWNPNVGYLHIKSFDEETHTAVVVNKNENANKAIGAAVLSGELFNVGIPNIQDSSATVTPTDGTYLLADFICPAIGKTQTISITDKRLIEPQSVITIAGNKYLVTDILDNNTIVIKNTGEGGKPGEIIKFDPFNCKKPSVPVLLYSKDPCEAESVEAGNLVVCTNTGLATLKGTHEGQLLIWKGDHWGLFNSDLDEHCTILGACLTIDTTPATDDFTPLYLMVVKDSGIFTVENRVTLRSNTYGLGTYIVKEIVSPTQLRITPVEVPQVPVIYAPGTPVCLEECCKWLPKEVQDTKDELYGDTWRPKSLQLISTAVTATKEVKASDITPSELTAYGNHYSTTTDAVRIANTNVSAKAFLSVRAQCWVHGFLQNTESAAGTYRMNLKHTLYIQYTVSEENANGEIRLHTYKKLAAMRKASYMHKPTAGESSVKSRDDFYQSEELFLELPAFDEDKSELSVVEITAYMDFKCLRNPTAKWVWTDESLDDDEDDDETKQSCIDLRLFVWGNIQ